MCGCGEVKGGIAGDAAGVADAGLPDADLTGVLGVVTQTRYHVAG